jgi:23S rRNA (cytosine1962-C5)-methyltransferase
VPDPTFRDVSGDWIGDAEVAKLVDEETSAHRVWTGRDAWVERFGEDFLISHPHGDAVMADELLIWANGVGLRLGRIFVRQLVKQPGERDVPRLVGGDAGADLSGVVTERGLRFAVDFGAGYSVGLFCDQRENRAYLETLRPRRVLNCFAYTGAFSVAAARAGAETLSVDLAKKALETGRRNLVLNDYEDAARHRFFVDDVFSVLPRLARRGECFDVIVLDPPTFSRGKGGRVFRFAENFPELVGLATALLTKGGRALLSTNLRELDAGALLELAGGGAIDPQAPAAGRARAGCSSFVWITRPAG